MDFYFDYTCPYAYLAFTQLEAFEAASGTRARLRPMLLGGVFAATGTPQKLFATLSPAKAKHNGEDMMRYAEWFGVPLRMPAEHPRRSVEALRATLATADGDVIDRRVVRGFYDAYWVKGQAPSDEATIREVVRAAGHDEDRVVVALGTQAIKDRLRALTDEAIGHGVFGAPALVREDGSLYWGQDRLNFAFGVPYAPPNGESSKAMTNHTLDFYWDFSSPYAYLAATQVEALAARTGATLRSRPMLLGGLFKSIGQVDVPLMAFSEAKRKYMLVDLQRWADHWGVPFKFPSRFPMNTVKALRVYLALPEARRAAFRAATFRAYWADDRDIADDAVLAELIGADAAEVLLRTKEPAIKEELFAATGAAAKAGAFGAPTWVVDGTDLYWGQDRIPLVERALAK